MKKLLVFLLLGALLLLTACGGGDVTTTTSQTTTTAATTTARPIPTSPPESEPHAFRYLSGDYAVSLYCNSEKGYRELKNILNPIQLLTDENRNQRTHITENKKGTPVGTLTWGNLSFENATYVSRNVNWCGEVTDEYLLEHQWRAVKWISEDGFAVIAASVWEPPLWSFEGDRVTDEAMLAAAADYMTRATGVTIDPSALYIYSEYTYNEDEEELYKGIFETRRPYVSSSTEIVAFRPETVLPAWEGMYVMFDGEGNIKGFFCRSWKKAADTELALDMEQIDSLVGGITETLDGNSRVKSYTVLSPLHFITYQDKIAVLVKIRVTVYECIAHQIKRSDTIYVIIH